VPVDSDIRAKFSSKIDPVTVNEKNFFILDASGPMAGEVTYQEKMAIFKPSRPLERGRQYNAVLTTGIKDLDGVPLPSNFTWSFVTEGEGGEDTLPPQIETTVPRNGENNVSHTAPIMVVFSEPIDPNTLGADTFFINGVSGSYTYDEGTRAARLQPSEPLALSTTYSVTVTRGIKDLAGNPLADEVTWSFRTALDRTPPTIKERSPGENATGVPVNTNISVSFDEQVDQSSLQSRFVLTGPSGEVPARFSYNIGAKTAMLDPNSDLDGETTYQVFVKGGVEDTSRNATSSDVSWFFTTGRAPDTSLPLIIEAGPQGEGVSVKSLITAKFSEPIKPDTLTGNIIVSSRDGVLPGDIRYESGSMTAIFTPSRPADSSRPRLEYRTTYTVLLRQGIEDLAGNRLAQVSWSFTTVDPPVVDQMSPVGQGISTDPPPAVQAVFSREMNRSSINRSSFQVAQIDPLNQQETMVPGTVSYDNRVATFVPSIPLSDNTLYRVTVTTAAEDINGNPLAADVSWTFQTAAPPDPAPRVASTDPPDGTVAVPVNIPSLSAQFQRPIDSSNLSSQFAVRETNGICCLPGRIEYDSSQQRAIFFTQSPLAYNTSYTAVLGAGIRSTSGTPMGVDHVWTFTTEAAPDTASPSVVGSDPADGTQGVPVTDLSGQPFQIRVDFSEPILASTVHATTFIVRRVDSEFSKPQIAGTYRTESASAFFVPSLPYDRGKIYEVTLTTGITDLAGNPLPSDVIRSFTTAP
jgi:hypothetical protein